MRSIKPFIVAALGVVWLASGEVAAGMPAEDQPGAAFPLSPAEVGQIAEEAYVYGFPMIMGYKVLYDSNVNKSSGQFKAPFNQIRSDARVFTYQDTTITTPNSDTPYSMLQADLRAQPIVLIVPEVDAGRYYSVQLTDMYTFNYGYIGSRVTGNGAGSYMIAGPDWRGETPAGIAKVFQPLIGPKQERVLLVSNIKRNIRLEPMMLALMTGNYQEQVTWRDGATGRVLAESDFFEPLTPGSLIMPGYGGRVYFPTGHGFIVLQVRPKVKH